MTKLIAIPDVELIYCIHIDDETGLPRMCGFAVEEFVDAAKELNQAILDYCTHPLFINQADVTAYFAAVVLEEDKKQDTYYTEKFGVCIAPTGEVFARGRMIDGVYNDTCN